MNYGEKILDTVWTICKKKKSTSESNKIKVSWLVFDKTILWKIFEGRDMITVQVRVLSLYIIFISSKPCMHFKTILPSYEHHCL